MSDFSDLFNSLRHLLLGTTLYDLCLDAKATDDQLNKRYTNLKSKDFLSKTTSFPMFKMICGIKKTININDLDEKTLSEIKEILSAINPMLLSKIKDVTLNKLAEHIKLISLSGDNLSISQLKQYINKMNSHFEFEKFIKKIEKQEDQQNFIDSLHYLYGENPILFNVYMNNLLPSDRERIFKILNDTTNPVSLEIRNDENVLIDIGNNRKQSTVYKCDQLLKTYQESCKPFRADKVNDIPYLTNEWPLSEEGIDLDEYEEKANNLRRCVDNRKIFGKECIFPNEDDGHSHVIRKYNEALENAVNKIDTWKKERETRYTLERQKRQQEQEKLLIEKDQIDQQQKEKNKLRKKQQKDKKKLHAKEESSRNIRKNLAQKAFTMLKQNVGTEKFTPKIITSGEVKNLSDQNKIYLTQLQQMMIKDHISTILYSNCLSSFNKSYTRDNYADVFNNIKNVISIKKELHDPNFDILDSQMLFTILFNIRKLLSHMNEAVSDDEKVLYENIIEFNFDLLKLIMNEYSNKLDIIACTTFLVNILSNTIGLKFPEFLRSGYYKYFPQYHNYSSIISTYDNSLTTEEESYIINKIEGYSICNVILLYILNKKFNDNVMQYYIQQLFRIAEVDTTNDFYFFITMLFIINSTNFTFSKNMEIDSLVLLQKSLVYMRNIDNIFKALFKKDGVVYNSTDSIICYIFDNIETFEPFIKDILDKSSIGTFNKFGSVINSYFSTNERPKTCVNNIIKIEPIVSSSLSHLYTKSKTTTITLETLLGNISNKVSINDEYVVNFNKNPFRINENLLVICDIYKSLGLQTNSFKLTNFIDVFDHKTKLLFYSFIVFFNMVKSKCYVIFINETNYNKDSLLVIKQYMSVLPKKSILYIFDKSSQVSTNTNDVLGNGLFTDKDDINKILSIQLEIMQENENKKSDNSRFVEYYILKLINEVNNDNFIGYFKS